jgi:hypothetical protein
MVFNRADLAASVSKNDAIVDAGGSLVGLLEKLLVEPPAAFYVAEQRALRIGALHSGISPAILRRAAAEGAAVKLTKRQRELMPIYAAAWLDGLAAGIRAVQDALTS